MASVFADFTALGLSYLDDIKGRMSNCKDDVFIPGDSRSWKEKHWTMSDCTCRSQDVIILAEFSEIKGPIPLLTIPVNTKNDLELDVDDFILKIMSVDYQACTSGCFRFTNDTQVLQTDVIQGVHAYVHYFSLNDIAARGFVRPLCLAYISKNRIKLESKLSLLKEKFLQSLEEDAGDSVGDEFMLSINLDQMVDQQNEYNKILQSARSILENKDLYNMLSPWKDAFLASDLPEIEQYMTYIKLVVGNNEPNIPSQRRSESNTELRPIAAISPFGVAIGVWYLCKTHIQFNNCDLELKGGCFWIEEDGSGDANPKGQWLLGSPKDETVDALSNVMYVQLLLLLLPASLSIPYEDVKSKMYAINKEKGENNMGTSGNEASSSYYSALESMNEAVNTSALRNLDQTGNQRLKLPAPETCLLSIGSEGTKQKRSSDISQDDDSSSDSAECVDVKVSEFCDFPIDELWCKCIWTGNTESRLVNPGNKIVQFFQTFSKVAQHILYSLLIGRTVVIAGSNSLRPKVLKIISAIVYFVPVQRNSKYLRWHRGILVSAHIEKYKVIGLCVPERLTVHDMISPRDKNSVTILDVNTKRILGPAYSGVLLANLKENFYQNFLNDEALVLFLQAVFIGIRQKVFLFKAMDFDKSKCTKEIVQFLGIKGRDVDIINYLKRFMTL